MTSKGEKNDFLFQNLTGIFHFSVRFQNLTDKKIIIEIIRNATKVINLWFAPKPRPIAIVRNRYESSSGSLIDARNLTMDKAPTRPRERARDDFTIVITRVVVRPKIIKFFDKSNLFDSYRFCFIVNWSSRSYLLA